MRRSRRSPQHQDLFAGLALSAGFAGFAVVLLAAACAGGRGTAPLPHTVGGLLRTTLESETLPAEVRERDERRHVWDEMRSFYEKRLWLPAWIGAGGPRPAAEAFLAAIPRVARDGLVARHYRGEELARRLDEVAACDGYVDPAAQRRLVETDLHLTYAFMTLAHHLSMGRLHPESLASDSHTAPRDVDLGALVSAAVGKPDEIVARLAALAPPQQDYERLRAALAAHREIAARGGWPRVPDGPALAPGAAGPRVALLRARLAASGDLPRDGSPAPAGLDGGAAAGPPSAPAQFDAALAQAVRRFQARHGLAPTGTVDDRTLAALAVPAAARVRQLEAAMERWRWMPADLGRRHIAVNVPAYALRVVEDGRTALTMRVIVGKDQTRTPAFSDTMTFLELNPDWTLPKSIIRNEVLPALGRDPSYLERHDMEVVRGSEVVGWADPELLAADGSGYGLRQRPGPANPLGQIKFMFPNDFDIYLHDTPADHLFDVAERDFSHGCIRLEKPLALAVHLLREDPRWSRVALVAAVRSGERRRIDLPRPIPVHILYWTAWVEPDGTVQFRDDLYGHDATLSAALAAEPPLDLELALAGGERSRRTRQSANT